MPARAANPVGSTAVTSTPSSPEYPSARAAAGVGSDTDSPRSVDNPDAVAASGRSDSSPIVALRLRSPPSRNTSIRTVVPGFVEATRFLNWFTVAMSWPSYRITMSPCRKPASSAGLPDDTSPTSAPFVPEYSKESARPSVNGWIPTPRKPRTTRPSCIRLSVMFRTMLIGIANPTPWYPPLRVAIAVLMPITCPDRLTSGPPLLPGLIAASVWMKSS